MVIKRNTGTKRERREEERERKREGAGRERDREGRRDIHRERGGSREEERDI